MQIGKRIDIVDLTKRAILVDRRDVVQHIMNGIVKRFNIDVIYAWLNPIFNEQTDYIIIGLMKNSSTMVIFHAIAFGECSTTQFDAYASDGNLNEFYSNLQENATCIPLKTFESIMRKHGLSTQKGNDMYWMNTTKKVSKHVVEALEELSPQLSHIKTRHR